MLKLNRKYKEAAFTKWLVCAGYIREALKARQLINIVATDTFLRQMFARFRHNLRIYQYEKIVDMNLQLDLSYVRNNRKEFFKKCTSLFLDL